MKRYFRKSIDRVEFTRLYNARTSFRDMATHFGVSEMTISRLRDDYGLPLRELRTVIPDLYLPVKEEGTTRTRKCCPACGSLKIRNSSKAVKNGKYKTKELMYLCEDCTFTFHTPATKEISVKKLPLPKSLATVAEKQMQDAV